MICIYLMNIRPQINYLIKDEIISINDIVALDYPINTLKYIFLNEQIFREVWDGKSTLAEVEKGIKSEQKPVLGSNRF